MQRKPVAGLGMGDGSVTGERDVCAGAAIVRRGDRRIGQTLPVMMLRSEMTDPSASSEKPKAR